MTEDSANRPKALVIGIGNEYRADDAFGPFVARRLKELLPDSVNILEHHGEGVSLMDAWAGYSHVILIDAIQSGAEPGTTFRIDATLGKLSAQFFHYSSHEFGVAEAIEMARVLGKLPVKMIVFGAEGSRFGLGEPMSDQVKAQVASIADSIVHEISLLHLS